MNKIVYNNEHFNIIKLVVMDKI